MINRSLGNGNGDGNGSRTRVLIVDDHPLMRRGLSELISREPDLLVCGEAEDAATALEIAKSANPHLMTVDISLKEGSGIELIKQLKASNPEISTLAFSMHDENLYAERAMRAGAKGYISKDAPSGDVIAAIRQTVPDASLELPAGTSRPGVALDITRLHQDTGFEPEYDTARAAADYIAWLTAGNPR